MALGAMGHHARGDAEIGGVEGEDAEDGGEHRGWCLGCGVLGI